jgi:REP-associated tyrosine transposase
MSRNPRVVLTEVPHHITQRGIRKTDVFCEPADYCRYTDLMVENCERFGVLIRSHVWMPNHIHWVAVPLKPDSFAKALRRAHSIYARWFNKKYGLSGYLWQDRFFSCPLDEDHFWAAMRYVERNPVRARLVARAEDYPWSSAAYHSFGRPNALIDSTWSPQDAIPDWSNWIAIPNDSAHEQAIRSNTRTGFPCGAEGFVMQVEKQLGRILRTLKRGPKPRERDIAGVQLDLLS